MRRRSTRIAPRFLLKPAQSRQELRDALKRFDVSLNNAEQHAVRSIDARLNALPEEEREEYLGVLRRYHNWLQHLPEKDRNSILNQPAEGRLARIKELAAKYPPSRIRAETPLDFIQIGGANAFELAALCKIWLALPAAERGRIDRLAAGVRRDALMEKGRELDLPRELKPSDYDEDKWLAEAESRIKDLGNDSVGPKDWVSKIETKFELAGTNGRDDGPKIRRFIKRLAANLFVQEHPQEHPVDAGRLAQFYAAIPTWIQSTFNTFPADEARRRLSVVYRIVYPHPEEYRAAPATKASSTPSKGTSAAPPGPTGVPPAVPPRPTANPSSNPF